MIRSLDELAPDGRAAALAFLDSAVAAVRPALRQALREDLTAHLCEHLDADAAVADVDEVVAGLGDLGETADASVPADAWHRLAAGLELRGLGSRLAASLWNPADERWLMPRAIGWGWDLNFGAVAVRLGLIEPDAEAVPFTATPPDAFRAAAAVPIGLAAAVGLRYLVRAGRLPARLPAHWDAAGRPDRWVGTGRAIATDLGVAAAAAGWAGWAAGSTRPGPSKAGMIAGATAAAGIAAATAVQRGLGRRSGPATAPVLLAGAMAGVGAVLVGLARAGRKAEISQDLKEQE